MTARTSSAWAGVVLFAGVTLIIISVFNIFEGIVTLIWDEHIVATRDGFVLVDLTSWGWTLLLFGLVMLAIGLGLLRAQTWARVAAIIVACIHAVWQVVSLGAYPVWSLLMIALDIVVIFSLTARWADARGEGATTDDLAPADLRPAQSYGSAPLS